MSKGMQVWSAGLSAYKAVQGLSWWSSVKTPCFHSKRGVVFVVRDALQAK